jgi:hypothetical protein
LVKETSAKEKYSDALGEQMAEMFAGYTLWIFPNDDWEADFKKYAWKGWELMNKLCNSTLVLALNTRNEDSR